jgi:hypothetical protein
MAASLQRMVRGRDYTFYRFITLIHLVHLYFLVSPFCDDTSNNKLLNNQITANPKRYHQLTDRTTFEGLLKTMNGVEYRVVEGPLTTTPDMNPVWVFRKQNRQRRAGQEDQITILGTYYCIATNIYQAPSLHDVIRCRMVRFNCQKCFECS